MVITGARGWTDTGCIRRRLQRLAAHAPVTIIHGNARGADQQAGHVARELGFEVIAVKAPWEVTPDTPHWAIRHTATGIAYDVRAGDIRNGWMLDMEPDLVIAFHDAIDEPGGTHNCVRDARKRGLAVDVVSHEGSQYTPGTPALF